MNYLVNEEFLKTNPEFKTYVDIKDNQVGCAIEVSCNIEDDSYIINDKIVFESTVKDEGCKTICLVD
jgi:hypothetical protein